MAGVGVESLAPNAAKKKAVIRFRSGCLKVKPTPRKS